MEAPSKVFLLLFLFSDWLKSNHLKSRIERGFLDFFSLNICIAVTETKGVRHYATSFGAMILDPWIQQDNVHVANEFGCFLDLVVNRIFRCVKAWFTKVLKISHLHI